MYDVIYSIDVIYSFTLSSMKVSDWSWRILARAIFSNAK